MYHLSAMFPNQQIPKQPAEGNSSNEFFEALAAAQKEYQEYVELVKLAEPDDSEFEKAQLQAIQRDMSHPLSLAIH
ncbi:MAG: hypothetical protein IPH05_08830 [Flavobacteriales bacterium]|jgi:hypothetical protein|nr:hypothetical protein [Flavobacteriales bacterium]MBK7112688.1 hypothetical protein [Flavobacteriales bacterium]MBK7620530.1 hypothetical protein [Flavobacteriales bacterium]MCC6939549.1 hypothetical protein [Flavobacteriales bacterium]HQW05388.1 hypothetical protein [Flavobacteriales bacterium]